MSKSKDELLKNEIPELPKVDYSNLPEELMRVVSDTPFIIERKTKLTWDGKQFSMRIPSEIAEELHITKENQIIFTLSKPRPNEGGRMELTIRLV